ncbi:unnamed protein product [Effrenium voratum]|uniref:Uncharacterized protein n=1 Tax=Effrenium voratum TaxID=2562239 RepID=A0AA36IIA1_9DINO|nr:unnamed protein product [Effrenium voratum]
MPKFWLTQLDLSRAQSLRSVPGKPNPGWCVEVRPRLWELDLERVVPRIFVVLWLWPCCSTKGLGFLCHVSQLIPRVETAGHWLQVWLAACSVAHREPLPAGGWWMKPGCVATACHQLRSCAGQKLMGPMIARQHMMRVKDLRQDCLQRWGQA